MRLSAHLPLLSMSVSGGQPGEGSLTLAWPRLPASGILLDALTDGRKAKVPSSNIACTCLACCPPPATLPGGMRGPWGSAKLHPTTPHPGAQVTVSERQWEYLGGPGPVPSSGCRAGWLAPSAMAEPPTCAPALL